MSVSNQSQNKTDQKSLNNKVLLNKALPYSVSISLSTSSKAPVHLKNFKPLPEIKVTPTYESNFSNEFFPATVENSDKTEINLNAAMASATKPSFKTTNSSFSFSPSSSSTVSSPLMTPNVKASKKIESSIKSPTTINQFKFDSNDSTNYHNISEIAHENNAIKSKKINEGFVAMQNEIINNSNNSKSFSGILNNLSLNEIDSTSINFSAFKNSLSSIVDNSLQSNKTADIMIYLNLKETLNKMDFSKGFKNFISLHYREDSNNYTEQIKQFNYFRDVRAFFFSNFF
jgi:hypothetical protein